MTENQRPHPSIAERIRLAKNHLGVSRREFEEEMVRQYNESDTEAMRDMVRAYLSWELQYGLKGKTRDEIPDLVHDNFDFVARAADTRRAAKDDVSTFTLALESDHVGPIQKFYRDVVRYHPKPNTSRLN